MDVEKKILRKIKPNIGEPCKNCGICCMSQPCRNGAYVLRLVSTLGDTVDGTCPALIKSKDNKYFCDIVRNPKKYIRKSKYPADVLSRNFAFLIGSGNGCDELLDDDTESEEIKLSEIIEKMKSNPEWVRKANIALKVVHGI